MQVRTRARLAGIAALLLAPPQQALAHKDPVACADLPTQFRARDVAIASVYAGSRDPNLAARYSCKKLNQEIP